LSNLVLGMLFPLATLNTGTQDKTSATVLNDIMPGLITLAVVAVWLGLTALGHPVPDSLNAILQVVVGFYFGQHVAMAAARGIIASNTAAADAVVSAAKAATDATAAAVAASNTSTAAAQAATAARLAGTTPPTGGTVP
jgi:hypothetical protein